jgi:hypothetical protein
MSKNKEKYVKGRVIGHGSLRSQEVFIHAAIIIYIDIGYIFPDESHTWGSFYV